MIGYKVAPKYKLAGAIIGAVVAPYLTSIALFYAVSARDSFNAPKHSDKMPVGKIGDTPFR
jgi:hypothetical protein